MSTEGNGENTSTIQSLPGVPEQTYLFPKPKGHSRSVSHGGTPNLAVPARPALKSAIRGHQRAFSHGQIGEGERPVSNHSRAVSRTEFILPPGHRDTPVVANASAQRRESNRISHSRQASRTDSIYTLRRASEVPKWRKAVHWMLRKEAPTPDLQQITVVPNHLVPDKTPKKDHPNGKRANNEVRTTKYTLLSFIPKNLFEQFHRIANVYFIFIVLLNWFPMINAFGKEVSMFPVLFVLTVTAIKDLFEDRRRHKSDKRINNSYCHIYKRSLDRYTRVKWKEVHVGDMVRLTNNEAVPADVVLLRSSDKAGVAFLDTCNIDGETNLKQRLVAPGFRDKQETFSPSKFNSLVDVDRPSTKIYRFNGTISNPNGSRLPISSENLLLRDCLIKNTDFVEGIVVYAGHETKAMLNNGGPRYKRSKLERAMNTDIVWCVLVLLLLCCVGAVGCKLWLDHVRIQPDQTTKSPYPPFVVAFFSPGQEGLLSFWTFVIILQVMIPVSLYVTIEVTKLLQVYHIHQDIEMYDEETNSSVQCRALNVTEELGQIQYVFSDKTGTLTENKMVFRRCCIDGVDYNHPPGPPVKPREDLPPLVTPVTEVSPNPRMLETLHEPQEPGSQATNVKEFLLVLAICNTVMVGQPRIESSQSVLISHSKMNGTKSKENYSRLAESRSTTPSPPPKSSRIKLQKLLPFGGRDRVAQQPDSSRDASVSTQEPVVHYEAESPDELALVECALAYGVELRARRLDEVTVGVLGDASRLRVLRVQQFDSARRCMSIAVLAPSGQVILYVKGADTTILNALAPMRDGSAELGAVTRTRSLIDEYARAGLRTLAFARRTMTLRAWEDWLANHHRLWENPEGRDRRLRESLARLESGLTLIGATGVEDSLQEDVPLTVRSLLRAGIVVWVLTGDKPETAVNVAYSAALFSQADRLLYLMARDKDQAENTIKRFLESAVGEGGARGSRALVVDGKTLTYILDRRSGLVAPFLSLARRCSAVLCCRASPLQKAYIVKAVKEELGVTTLAVGDGANDVSMIQTADVGVGLSGQEGRQAVMSSDFAVPRFKHLRRLLLVHGHWCYSRLATLILYFLLKNIMFVLTIFWFQLYCMFSSQVQIDQMHLMCYNLIFTALPPLAIGAYDRVAPAALLLERPELYAASRRGRAYTPRSYWLVVGEALYISVVVFFTSALVVWDTDTDLNTLGLANMTTCLVVVTLYVAIEAKSLTLIHVASLLVSLAMYTAFTFVYHSLRRPVLNLHPPTGAAHHAVLQPAFWLLVLVSTVAALVPRVFWHGMRNSLWPGRVWLGVMLHRRPPRSRLPYTAHYHTDSRTAHLYRTRDEDGTHKASSEVTAIT